MNEPLIEPQYESMSPVQIWIKAITSPKEETYKEIIHAPNASLGSAVLWLAAAGFLGGLLQGLVGMVTKTNVWTQFSQFSQYTDYNFAYAPRTGFISVIGGAFGGLFGILIGTFIVTGLVQLVAKMLGGTGTFADLFYGFAAYQAPMRLVTLALGAIPFVGACLGIPLAIYGLVLNVIANKAANEYDTGKAVISSLAPWLLIFLVCACVLVIASLILVPVAGDVFQNLQ